MMYYDDIIMNIDVMNLERKRLFKYKINIDIHRNS